MNKTFLPKGGGYRKLRVYKLSEAIHDLTVIFAEKYIERGSRTKDQMVQAARIGKQNIAEGSAASSTSKETEIKLTNVAKASLEELLIDYEDFLRQHNLLIWDKNHPRTNRLRDYLRSEKFLENPLTLIGKMNSEEFCNMAIILINQTTYILNRLIEKQQEQFLIEGGIKERMFKARLDYRSKFQNSPTSQTGQTSQNYQIGQSSRTSLTKED